MDWVDDGNVALLTDLYQLTMVRAYLEEGLTGTAVFDLTVRSLPPGRNFLVACGLSPALHYLETLSYGEEALRYLASLPAFPPGFTERLRSFRFTGSVRAVPEGTPIFAGEPLLSVTAPLPEAQLVETFLMNQVAFSTAAASKAARVVAAAGGRPVVDFGLRRMQGADAGMKAARAFAVAGVAATSNVLAGLAFGLPVAGTMAHSYIEAHDDEGEAFRRFAAIYPETILLVDTYDTIEGVRKVVRLAGELGDGFRIRAIRLDSGDLAALAREARRILDEAGLDSVEIFASGGLDEFSVADLVGSGAPVDGFGVGTRMGVAADAPYLDAAYKLVQYEGRGRMKLSPGKHTLPGLKQVCREEVDGVAVRDVIGLRGEDLPGRPLLETVMRGGERTEEGRRTLGDARDRFRGEEAKLPPRIRSLEDADPPYEVKVSPGLSAATTALRRSL